MSRFGWCTAPDGAKPQHRVCPIRLPNPHGRLVDPAAEPGQPDWRDCDCECHDELLGRARDTDGQIIVTRRNGPELRAHSRRRTPALSSVD